MLLVNIIVNTECQHSQKKSCRTLQTNPRHRDEEPQKNNTHKTQASGTNRPKMISINSIGCQLMQSHLQLKINVWYSYEIHDKQLKWIFNELLCKSYSKFFIKISN